MVIACQDLRVLCKIRVCDEVKHAVGETVYMGSKLRVCPKQHMDVVHRRVGFR